MAIQTGITAPIFSGANGGLSDDIFTGIADSFYSAYNINIRDNSKGISLNKALVKDSGTVITEKINVIIKVSSTDLMAFGNSGGIYRKRSGTWVKITTDSPAEAILSAIEFNGYIYWTTASYIHRLLKTNISDDISATDVINRQALNTSAYHPLLVRAGTLYIGNGKGVDKVDIYNVFAVGAVLESNANVKFLDKLGSTIKVVMEIDLGGYNIYLWNGGSISASGSLSQTIPISGLNIYQTTIFNGLHYLATSKGLLANDGYRTYYVKNIDKFSNEKGGICVLNDKIIVSGTNGVYTYGAKNKNYSPALNLEWRSSNGNDNDVIGATYSDGTDLYVSWSNGSNYGIDKLSTTVYCTSGELITRGYYADSFHKIKDALYASFGIKPLIAGQYIKLYYSVDGGEFTQLFSITENTDMKINFSDDIFIQQEFQYIQFKIEMTGPGTSTPEFYNLILTLNNDIER